MAFSIYKKPFVLKVENRTFHAQLCLLEADLESLQTKSDTFLHPDEEAYYKGLQYSKRQLSFLLGRLSAKHALSSYINTFDFKEIYIQKGILDQPVASHANINNMQVSISHTENYGASIAFSEAVPMAIDIEMLSPKFLDTIKEQLSPQEKNLIASQENKEIYPFIFWTVKEALSKVLKCGLSIPYTFLEVESIEQKENYFISQFTHFSTYQALSFLIKKNILCSLVFPIQAEIEINSYKERLFMA